MTSKIQDVLLHPSSVLALSFTLLVMLIMSGTADPATYSNKVGNFKPRSCILRKIKHLIKYYNMVETSAVTYLQHKSVSNGEGSNFFKKYLVRKHIFAIDYQENTIVCLLQPKFLGGNDLYTGTSSLSQFCFYLSDL